MNLSRLMGKLGLVGGLLSVAFLVGCGTTNQGGRFDPIAEEGPPPPVETPVDIIRAGEAITITITDTPMLIAPIEERVKEDGTITLIQNQTFVAAGKTRRQLETEIRARYVPDIYRNMSVSIKQQENTRFYFVGGEVRSPGRQVYLGHMTVLRAIQSCGDFTEFANRRRIQLIRASGKIERVDAKKALRDPSLDPPVYPGDRIHVPRSIW